MERKVAKIATRGLNLFYGTKQALFEINIDIPSFRVTALIGPSGCGKSSFLRVLNRLHDLNPEARVEGEVILDGQNIYLPHTDVIALRRRVGMVFQRPTALPMSVYDNVAYGPRLFGIKKRKLLDEIVENCLRKANLWEEVKDRLKAPAQSLSGGQQQRLAIARILAQNPEVILMDEPASALDPIATARLEELIVKLKQNYTVIIVTHNMQQAARISDYTGFFLHGRLIEFAPTANLFVSPREKATEDYITGRFG